MKHTWKLALVLFFSIPAFAAQYGKIVVESANVYEFPNSGSSVIGQVVKDQELATSNLPTENFYKVRLQDGRMGWISGNDIFVSKTPFQNKSATPEVTEPTEEQKPAEAIESAEETLSKTSARKEKSRPEHSRILLAGGLGSLSYGGIPSSIEAKELNYSIAALAEFQFKWSEDLFWAFRVEYFSASSGELAIATNVKETISQSILPLQFGVNYSLIRAPRFRLGVGAYVGATILSNMKVALDDSTSATPVRYEVEYPSFDPCATLALQTNIGLSARTGILIEASYRYQKTGEFSSTTLGSSIPAFTADYSGLVGRLGLEFRL